MLLLHQLPFICRRPAVGFAGAREPSVASMAALGGGLSPPSASISAAEAFRRLLKSPSFKPMAPSIPKFIKKLDEVPEIDLPSEQPIKIALTLAERGLVGQFMGLRPSTRTTDDWIQRN